MTLERTETQYQIKTVKEIELMQKKAELFSEYLAFQ